MQRSSVSLAFVVTGVSLGAVLIFFSGSSPESPALLEASGRMATQPAATTYSPVTDERLQNPSPDDWLMYRRTYDSWGYSPLNQITSDNVTDLVPVWTISTGVISGHQAPPQVNDGVMFVKPPESQVMALDARSGNLMWRYVRQLPDDIRRGHRTNRGVGLYGDLVFVTAQDAHVVALDATSGEVVWDLSLIHI